jgi:dTMP kinase
MKERELADGRDCPNMTGPLFIVLEGIDGAGTTTQTARLVERLTRLGRSARATREPSQGPVGRLLREILQGAHRPSDQAAMNGNTLALLFAADRRDHLQREIEPLLLGGHDVVSDRYLLSSLAYQAEEADRAWVASLAREIRTPDLTLLLDVPVEVAAQRRRAAGRSQERYEEDDLLARVADNYRRLSREHPDVLVLDGSQDVDQVELAVATAVQARLAGGRGSRS